MFCLTVQGIQSIMMGRVWILPMAVRSGVGRGGSCLCHILVDQEMECGIQQLSPFLLLIQSETTAQGMVSPPSW